MISNDSVETTAPTIDQAINQALAQLGADQDDVEIEVLTTPRAGVLGLGARQAKVRVTRRPPQGASSGVTSPPPAPPLIRQPQKPLVSPSRPETPSRVVHPGPAAPEPLPPAVKATPAAPAPNHEVEETPAPSRPSDLPR